MMRITTVILAGIILAAAVLDAQEGLGPLERERIMKKFPQSAEELVEQRERDTIIKKNGDVITCDIIAAGDINITLRLEGQRIALPFADVRRILLAQTLYDVFGNRLDRLDRSDWEGRYALALEALAHRGDDPRFEAWAETVFKAGAEFGGHIPSYIAIGDLLAERRKFAIADLYYSKAAELAPGNFDAIRRYAVNLRIQRKFAAAEKYYRQALALSGGDLVALEGLGYVLLKQGRLKDAREFYDQAAAVDPAYPPVLTGQGLLLAHSGDLLAAREAFLKAMEAAEPTVESHLGMGMLDYRLGMLDAAEAHFLKAAALAEGTGDEPVALAHLAMVNTVRGAYDRNDAIFRNFETEEIRSMPDVANAMGFHFLKKGGQLGAAGDTAGAREQYTLAREAFQRSSGAAEGNYYALYGMGLAEERLGNRREAVAFLNRAYEFCPTFIPAKLTVALMFLDDRDYTAARREFDTVDRMTLPRLKQNYTRFKALAESGTAEALSADAAVLQREAQEALVLFYVGYVRTLLAIGDADAARARVEEFRTLLPNAREAYDYLGYIWFTAGDEDRAKDCFKTGKDLGSSYSQRRYLDLLIARNQAEHLDDFNREDNDFLRNNWEETERAGIEAYIRDKHGLLEGTVTKAWAQSYFARSYPSARFVSMSVNLTLEAGAADFFTGVFILGQKNDKGLFLIRNDKGEICFATHDKQAEDDKGWKWFPIGPWPATATVTLGLRQADRSTRKFDLYINDEKVKTLMSSSLMKEEYFKLGCFVQGREGTVIRAAFDDFRVITEKID